MPNFCSNCGAKLSSNAKFCGNCGNPIDDTSEVQVLPPESQQSSYQPQQQFYQQTSPQMPQQLPSQQLPPQQFPQQNIIINSQPSDKRGLNEKNKYIALLLCFFLGCLGAHKFYEGKIFMGILYFLIFLTSFFYIGLIVFVFCFVDFIMLLFRPNPYYVGY